MTIAELERQIVTVGLLLATAQLQYERDGSFVDAGAVSAYELQMRRLVEARDVKAEQQ